MAAVDGGRRAPARRSGERALAGVAGGLALGAAALTPVAGTARTVDALGGRTFVVNSTGDDPDGSTGDGVYAVAGAPGRCTLRAAIEQANASGGHDRIEFRIPGAGPHTLRPLTRYPIISDPAGLTIDGYTQPGSRVNTAAHGSNADIRIELHGRGPTDIDGLYVISADNVIRGLAMYDFKRTLYLRTAGAVGNEIVGNFIGTNAAGTFERSSRVINDNGVHLERGASDNRIGMPGTANRNVISGNGDRGIALYDPGTDRNRIRNNVIGLSPTGSRLRNWGHGIDINYDPSFNVIGGRSVGEGNVLSGNELSGVEISHDRRPGSTTGNQVIGNLIGTSVDGSRGDDQYRNREFGVNLEGNGACVYTCPPDINDNLVEANRIVGSSAGVMIWKGAHDNVVRNNVIGLLPDGTVAPSASSTLWGVLIETGAFDNLIDSNTIAGGRDGIQVRPTTTTPISRSTSTSRPTATPSAATRSGASRAGSASTSRRSASPTPRPRNSTPTSRAVSAPR